MENKWQIFKSFHLKIIAMVCMVFDHVGYLLIPFSSPLYAVFRAIGRIAYPLFGFMVVEGLHYSKKPLAYLLKLLTLGLIIDVFSYFINFYIGACSLISFFIAGLAILIFEKGKSFFKLLGIIPLILGIIPAFDFCPFSIQYGPYGLIMILLFYLARKISDIFSIQICSYGLDLDTYKKSSNYTLMYTLICFVFLISLNLLCSIFQPELMIIFNNVDIDYKQQSYSIIAGLILLLYNGQRGYNAKWFQYGCYLFFPLHFIIIGAIYFFSNL